MGDAILLAVGALIFASGYVSGRIGRAHRTPKTPKPYVCGCGHHLAKHDPKTNACNVMIIGFDVDRPCPCMQYIGERPLDLGVLADQARAAQLRTEGNE
jgi:hypothetical protein